MLSSVGATSSLERNLTEAALLDAAPSGADRVYVAGL